MATSAKPIEKVYILMNERGGVERSFDLLLDLDFDPLRTHWEPDGRVWIVFSDMKDAIHFRLRFAGRAELTDSCEEGVAAVLMVSLDLRHKIADWIEQTSLEGQVMWAERVRVGFENVKAQRAFEAAL